MPKSGNAQEKRVRTRTLLIGGVSTLLILLASWTGMLDGLNFDLLDSHFRLRGPEPPPPEVVVVSIDETSMAEVDQRWPWKRAVHGQLIEALQEAGSRVIAFDLFFGQPSEFPGDDDAFADDIRATDRVVLVDKIDSTVEAGYRTVSLSRPAQTLVDAGPTLGLANQPFDPDGFVRRGVIAKVVNDELHLSLPIAALAEYEGVAPDDIHVSSDGRTVSVGNIEIPVRRSKDGYDILINYAGSRRTIKTISYYQVLQKMVPEAWLRDKVVFIGAGDPTLRDTFQTPFSGTKPMPGVEVHANVLATVLQGKYIHRTSPLMAWLLLLVVGLGVSALLSRLGAWKGLFLAVLVGAGLWAVSLWLFVSQRLWLPVASPMLAVAVVYGSTTAYRFVVEEGERRRVRGLFGRYVSDAVVDEIVDSQEDVALGGKRQRVTILFSDIRGFTSMSENMAPEDVVALLNEYFEEMTEIIFQHGGTIDKFVGDCIMALFGAPIAREDDAERCLRAAIEMRQGLARLQEKWQSEGKRAFDTGIGINSGEVVVGNIGSRRRVDYTVIGDEVNLAARLESITKEYQSPIIISENTYQDVKHLVDAEYLDSVKVKGKERPVRIYRVNGWIDQERLTQTG